MYWNVYGLPAVSVEAGQSARAWSKPWYLSSPALHSLPSGMSWRLCPAALSRCTSFQSYNGCVPPIATAAWQAAEVGCSGFSRKHS